MQKLTNNDFSIAVSYGKASIKIVHAMPENFFSVTPFRITIYLLIFEIDLIWFIFPNERFNENLNCLFLSSIEYKCNRNIFKSRASLVRLIMVG